MPSLEPVVLAWDGRNMGFGIRVMPGVRISASSRGVRAGIGPRAARVHAGSGRTGFSTGAGPLTYYTSGSSRRGRSGQRAPSMAAHERQVRAAERQAELEHWIELNQQMLSLAYVHTETFTPRTEAPVAPAAEPIDEAAIAAEHQRAQREGISVFKRAARRAAKIRAAELAADEVAGKQREQAREQAEYQEHLDGWWRQLLANDRDVVFESIEMAFDDNEMPAAPMDVDGDAATLLMRIPAPGDLIPEREATTTPTGRPTHKRRTKSTVNHLYAEILASHALATVKEALAVAPGLATVKVLVIRGDQLGGGLQLIPLYTGAFARGDLATVPWHEINALALVEQHGEIRYKGQAQEVAPLTTKGDPALRDVLDELAEQLEWKAAP